MTVSLDSLPAEARRNCQLLPEIAFAFIGSHAAGKRIVAIKRGETGFYETTLDHPNQPVEHAQAIVQAYNDRLGVSPEQQAALVHGSLFGFDTPGANPQRYDGDRLKADSAVRP